MLFLFKERIIAKAKNQLQDCDSSKYLKNNPLLAPLLNPNANEFWLFHGCNDKVLPELLTDGYDPRMSHLNGMFGGGFYLAENSSKSNQYIPCPMCGQNAIGRDDKCSCENQEDLEFTMIIYRAILGDIHIAKTYDKDIYRGSGSFRVRRPPKKNSNDIYDSVMGESIKYGGNRLQYREFILYESGQAYPEYVVKYKRSAKTLRLCSDSDIQLMRETCQNFLGNICK